MPTDNPFAKYVPQQAPQAGPVIAPPDPYKQQSAQNDATRTGIAVQQERRQEAQNTWTTLTPQEVQQMGLPTGPMYQRSGTGEIKSVGDVKGAANPTQTALNTIKSIGVDLTDPNDRVSKLIEGSTSGVLEATAARGYGAVTGSATPGMKNIGQLQAIVSDLVLQATGGGLGNQVSDADRNFIVQRMGDIANPDVPADQRLAAWREVKGRLGRALGVQIPDATSQATTQDNRDQAAGAVNSNGGVSFGDGPDSGPPPGQVLLGHGQNADGSQYPIYGVPPAVSSEAQRLDSQGGQLGYLDLARQGLTLGLTDEASGIGTAVGRMLGGDFSIARNYGIGRDAQELRLQQARDRLGVGGTVAETLGSFALPANALTALGTRAAAKGGAIAGGVAGFGSGRGYDQSTQNALIGTVAGGALGYAGQRVGNALAARTAGAAPTAEQAGIIAAGERQGVPIRQPDVRPELRGKFAATEQSASGGPAIRAAIEGDRAATESAVRGVGKGSARDEFALGETTQGAANRASERMKAETNALYTKARRLAGDARVEPTETVAAIDQRIAELRATGESANSSEIGVLEGIKGDLQKSGLTIDSLQAQRKALRDRISGANMDPSRKEADFMQILGLAGNELERGLAANPATERAAGALKTANQAYAARREFRDRVAKQFLGTKNAPVAPETAATRFLSMVKNKGDYNRFSRMFAELEPGERADFASTVAEGLGTKANGQFEYGKFLRDLEGVNPRALREIFGKDGVDALNDLKVIAAAKSATLAEKNTSRTGGVVQAGVNRLQGLVLTLFGGATGGVSGAVAGGLASSALEKFGSRRAARMLLNPNFTKWLRRLPNTTDPRAIDATFARLDNIAAKAGGQMGADVAAFKQALIAANDNVGVSAAASDGKENQQQQ